MPGKQAVHEAGSKIWTLEYDSYEQVLDNADLDLPLSNRSSHSESSGAWYGTRSFWEASKLAREGWPEGLEKIAALSERIGTVVGQYVQGQSLVHDVQGAYVDVGRFLEGDPENMIDFAEELKLGDGGRIVKLVIDTGASCGITGDQIFRRGAAIIALVDALEKAGLVAEIELLYLTNSEGHHRGKQAQSQIRFLVKRAGENIELDRIAYLFAHSSWIRRHAFALQEGQSEEYRRLFGIGSGCYGYPCNKLPEQFTGDGIIAIDALGSGDRYTTQAWNSEASAIAWVLDQLKAQGVLLVEGGAA